MKNVPFAVMSRLSAKKALAAGVEVGYSIEVTGCPAMQNLSLFSAEEFAFFP